MDKLDNVNAIEVDGVRRPRFNSNKQPIHTTDDGIKNFWRWFGDSKMVDGQGRPLPFYHGTDADFTEFLTSTIGQAQDGKLFAGSGFYFADNQNDAGGYGSKVVAVYLKIENPLDMRDKDSFKEAFKNQVPYGQQQTLGEISRDYGNASRLLDIQDVVVMEERKGFFDVQWKIAGEWQSNWPQRASSLELSDDLTGLAYARRRALPVDPDAFLNAAAYSRSSIDSVLSGVFDGVVADGSIGHIGDEYVVFDPDQLTSSPP